MNQASRHEFTHRQRRDHLIAAHKFGSYFVPKKHKDTYKTLGQAAILGFNIHEAITLPVNNTIYKNCNI
jgi:hypothetical protein